MNAPVASGGSPEQEVILSALRTGRGWEDRVRESLRREPDWDILRRTAGDHGVLPFLYARLKEAAQDLVPQAEMDRWKGLYQANARRNLVLTARLLKVLRVFEEHGIRAVPFKGPVLAEAAYGDIALRTFCDLDLLVRERDIPKVKELLVAGGFRPWYAFTKRQEERLPEADQEYPFEAGNGEIQLDVHWRFAPRYMWGRDIGGALDRARPGRVGGGEVSLLSDEDTLLMLCLHGTFHLWTRLGLVCDVARFLEARAGMDLPGVLRTAEESGLRRVVLLGLALARDLLGAELPEGIGEEIEKDRAVGTLRAHVRSTLFRREAGSPGFRETAWFQLKQIDRFADKAGYVLIRALMPTVEDWKRFPLPDSLYFLYFLYRPLRLLGLRLPARLPRRQTPTPAEPRRSCELPLNRDRCGQDSPAILIQVNNNGINCSH